MKLEKTKELARIMDLIEFEIVLETYKFRFDAKAVRFAKTLFLEEMIYNVSNCNLDLIRSRIVKYLQKYNFFNLFCIKEDVSDEAAELISEYNEVVEIACNLIDCLEQKEFLAYLTEKLKAYPSGSELATNINNQPGLIIPEYILIWLEGKGFIEKTYTKPKWLKTKQLARELLTHEKIKGSLINAEVERQAPYIFVDENNKPLNLAKNKPTPSHDSDDLRKFLATL